MDVQAFLGEISTGRRYRGQIEHVETVRARPATCAQPKTPLRHELVELLERRGISQLYQHQADALDAIGEQQDIVIVTATASGKTLCYNLPVMEQLLSDPNARAMYLFPTKALAQDQLGTLREYADDEALAGHLVPAVYDGDTPTHNRAKIRKQANVVLTNPDMLHVGILPHHAKWHEFFRNLRYLVIDELHSYRGIFGSHVAGVLRRLLRICAHYGNQPQIIAASATIGNPVELASELTGRPMRLIDSDGSPQGQKHVVMWNPPPLDDAGMERRSGNIEAVELLCQLVERKAQTIVFGQSRVVVELIHKYATEFLRERKQGELADRIKPYRGGYLPTERRAIEKELFEGKLLAVASTNALELGIDVGGLDAAILVGLPNTVCSLWQQAGRAGRTSQDSLVILVGYNQPADQYMMRHPEFLFGASHEHGVIDPTNPYILSRQLSCACFEKPLTADDASYFGQRMEPVLNTLASDGAVRSIDDRAYWAQTETPAIKTNLRTISDSTVAIVEARGDERRAIGNVDGISAVELVYPNAVYLHEGESYVVRELDLDAQMAIVERMDVDYYTQPIMTNSCTLREPETQAVWRTGQKNTGPVTVSWQTTGFQKIKYYTMENIGQSELDLPAQQLETTGCWFVPPEEMMERLAGGGYNPIEALCGLRTLLIASLPRLAMCDPRDISGQVDSRNLGRPAIVVYDRYPGGVGFAMQGYERMDEWLGLAGKWVRDCPCLEGCPACVGLPFVPPGIQHDVDLYRGWPTPSKSGAIRLIEFLDAEAST